jgi:hypothetical protein
MQEILPAYYDQKIVIIITKLAFGSCPVQVNVDLNQLATFFNPGFLINLFFWTLKMEAICSSETSVDTQRTP